MGNDPLQCAAVQAHAVAIRQGPANAGCREAEGGGLREADHFLGRDETRQLRADAVMERVSGREDAGRPAPAGEDQRVALREGAGPWARLSGKRASEGEMAGAVISGQAKGFGAAEQQACPECRAFQHVEQPEEPISFEAEPAAAVVGIGGAEEDFAREVALPVVFKQVNFLPLLRDQSDDVEGAVAVEVGDADIDGAGEVE